MYGTHRTVISDKLWQRIEPLLCGRPGDRGVTGKDNRRFLEGVCWIGRTGAPWRDLPRCFGPWNTVYRRYRRWAIAGVWQRIGARVVPRRPARGGARPCAMLDSTAVRVHQHGAPPRVARDAQAVGKPWAGWTSKVHAAVDA